MKFQVCNAVKWIEKNSWIAVFDILGFKNLIRQVNHENRRALLTSRLDELIKILDLAKTRNKNIDYLIFSDTFVVRATDLEPKSYPWFLSVCKELIKKSIVIGLPLRGAISAGIVFTSTSPLILMGASFVEAYEYCEDQKWIGLLLTPLATQALSRFKLDPLRHDFVSDPQIPLCKKSSEGVLAYRFQNGRAKFKSPLLSFLAQMQHKAVRWKDKEKYERTAAFIKRNYRFAKS